MERPEITAKVVTILSRYARNAEGMKAVSESSRVLEDLGVTSARLVDILLDFEDDFGVAIPDEAADRIRTVGEIVDLLSQPSP